MASLGRRPGAAPLTTADIPDNSITAAKIVDATIAAGDLAPNSVDSSELVDGSIDTSHIGANQVTAAKVAADVATQAELDTVSTVASAALPKAGGTMTGNIVMGDDTSIGIADDAERIEFDGAGDISVLGANLGIGTSAPSYPLQISTSTAGRALYVAQTYATGTVYGGVFEAEGASTTNVGFMCKASGATNNYGLLVAEGKVGIGTSSPGYDLSVKHIIAGQGSSSGESKLVRASAGATENWFYLGSGGLHMRAQDDSANRMSISSSGTFSGSASNDISDERLKENITTIPDALTKIQAIKGRTFTWKPEADMPAGTKFGLIAQELESTFPDLVDNEFGIRIFDKDGNFRNEDGKLKTEIEEETDEYAKSISMSGLIPVLIEAVKELSAKVTALESA